jgi:hypothetical protein
MLQNELFPRRRHPGSKKNNREVRKSVEKPCQGRIEVILLHIINLYKIVYENLLD